MADETQRPYKMLYFENQEVNGKKQSGKFKPLRVRFLYPSIESIPLGRTHLQKYGNNGRFARILCLNNGKPKAELSKDNCPLCKASSYDIPSNKYYAFVEDLNDGSALKLLEFNWGLGKQLDEIAEIKGRPLHDLVFTLSKKGEKLDTSYTPILEDTSKFDVAEYLGLLGLEDFPQLTGIDHVPILQLTEEQIVNFLKGIYPWASKDGGDYKKRTVLGGVTVTVRGAQTAIVDEEEDDVVDEVDDFEATNDRPSPTGFF